MFLFYLVNVNSQIYVFNLYITMSFLSPTGVSVQWSTVVWKAASALAGLPRYMECCPSDQRAQGLIPFYGTCFLCKITYKFHNHSYFISLKYACFSLCLNGEEGPRCKEGKVDTIHHPVLHSTEPNFPSEHF